MLQATQPTTYHLPPAHGFTLVELMIAVGIIGLLASVSLVNVNSIRAKARDSKRLADIKEVQKGLEAYYVTNGYYPFEEITEAKGGLGSKPYSALCNSRAGFEDNAGLADNDASTCVAPTYMAKVNESAAPARKPFLYAPTPPGCNNNQTLCRSYKMNFELETETGSLQAGCLQASPDGVLRVGDIGDAACGG